MFDITKKIRIFVSSKKLKLTIMRNIIITALNHDTNKEQVLTTSIEWAMTEKNDGYFLGNKKEQTKEVNYYLDLVANETHDTIFELISFEIK